MLAEIPAEELTAALDACAVDVLWEAGITGPPVDTTVVAERLGLLITHNATLACRGRLVELADPRGGEATQSTIVVGPTERPERLQWTVAHEIGESAAYRVYGALGIPGDEAADRARESVANHLASCLLLPRDWFAVDGERLGWDLFALKQRYATASHELIARRMLEMNVPIVVTLFDQGRVRWRRSNTGGRPPELTREESQAWKSAHAANEPCAIRCNPETTGLELAQAWPVHEPHWKREILRSRIAEW